MWGRPNREDELARLLSDAQLRVTELETELRTGAERDTLTGLTSHGRFRAQLDIEVERARRHGRVLALAVLDVDGFCKLNAEHGHSTGDQVLRAVADALRVELRNHDGACRAGADSFAVLMPETDPIGAANACERVLHALEGARAGVVESVRVSAGVAALERGQTSAGLVGAAHQALDHARALGGGRAVHGPTALEPVDANQRDVVSALAVALLERDRYTGEHSESVTDLCESVGRALGLSSQEIEHVKDAALLHDIGKVAIPDEILNKPAKLTDDEFEVMKTHTVVGERILRAIPGYGPIARIVRHEHERWDGRGYPDGIAGEEIPVGARIILACDAYHAMTSDRPYRRSMGHAAAVHELLNNAGAQFDPGVVEALVGQLYARRQSGAAAPAAG